MRQAGSTSPLRLLVWGYIALVLMFLYVPLIPPMLFSLWTGGPGGWTLRWYAEMWRNPILTSSMLISLEIGLAVAVGSTVLGLAASMAIRELRIPRVVLLLMLLPLFIPGVSMGLATAFFFRQLGIAPSLVTMAIVQMLWALPFATLVLLTAMSTFDPVYLEAAYMSGANRGRAF